MDFNSLPFLWVLLDENLNITEYNSLFQKALSFKTEIKGKSIKEAFPDFDPVKEKQLVKIKGEPYIFTSVKTESGLSIFMDKCCFSQAPVNIAVGLIFIDNFGEALENVAEKRQGVIRVITDNKISDFFRSIGGIVRRFENDKYMFFLTGEGFEKCRKGKFSILEGIKQIDCGDNTCLTLSIGVGINGKTLRESLDFAKAAVDLALSRGGDQAIIKDNEEHEFFGGGSQGSGHNSRVRARAKAYALADLIKECTNVIVMGHKNADFDALGACVGLCRIAKTLNRPFNIVLGEVSSSVSLLYDRIKEDKEYKDKLISPDEAENYIKERTLLIICDCHLAAQCETDSLIKKAGKYVIFDHHRKAPNAITGYVLSYLEPKASSTCELICEMLIYMSEKIRLKPLEAGALLSGIMLDTKFFTVKTGIQTFEAASFLKKQGADTIRVKLLFKESKKAYFDRIETIRSCKIINGNMAIAICGRDCENPYLTTASAADELLKISGIEVAFVLAEVNSMINISMRSLGKINVSLVAEKLGGGGHFEAAACQLKDKTIEEAKKLLTEAINEIYQ
ncbi:MAG: DHH family phosphoesterase [Clostridiales bacterium]|nr:DHH family phosphoesterase [Clostridiales bacterium]